MMRNPGSSLLGLLLLLGFFVLLGLFLPAGFGNLPHVLDYAGTGDESFPLRKVIICFDPSNIFHSQLLCELVNLFFELTDIFFLVF
jgi:hypothetical protein